MYYIHCICLIKCVVMLKTVYILKLLVFIPTVRQIQVKFYVSKTIWQFSDL